MKVHITGGLPEDDDVAHCIRISENACFGKTDAQSPSSLSHYITNILIVVVGLGLIVSVTLLFFKDDSSSTEIAHLKRVVFCLNTSTNMTMSCNGFVVQAFILEFVPLQFSLPVCNHHCFMWCGTLSLVTYSTTPCVLRFLTLNTNNNNNKERH